MDEDADYMQTDTAQKKVRHRKKRLYQAILQQMEFYFSDSNLLKDRFLGKLVQDNEGYVDLSIFLTFNRIKNITTNMEDIVKALRNSELLSVSEDGSKVYRATPVKEKENIDDCTIYVEQLPPDADHDWLKGVFSVYGKVAYVSIPKYKGSGKIKGFAFIEFDTPEEANKTLEAFGAMGCCLPTQIPPEQLCSIATFERDDKDINGHHETEQEAVIEEPVPEHQPVEDIPKKKRKREVDDNDLNEEPVEQQSGPSVKKKKKKTEELVEDDDGKEGKEPSDEVEESVPEKKTNNVEVEPNVNLEISSEPSESGNKKKKKRKHSEPIEDVEDKEGTNDKEEDDGRKRLKAEDCVEEQEVEEVHDEGNKRKRNRKRNKKNKKDKSDLDSTKHGLRILSKREWKRLRNKYLELQKKKMKSFKQYLGRSRWTQQSQPWRENRQDGGENVEVEEAKNVVPESQMRTVFTPGVIIHVSLDSPVDDVKKFKTDAKVHPDVKYVDVNQGDVQVYLRCSSPEAAKQLVSKNPWKHMTVLQGEEETSYWEKIKQDRDEKIGKKVRVKRIRGRDRLLKKAETAMGKHMRFDDLEEQE